MPTTQVPPVAQVSAAAGAGAAAAGASAIAETAGAAGAAGVVDQALAPVAYVTRALLAPYPLMFFEFAYTLNDLPLLIDLIVQEVLVFAIVQVVPPALTLLPVTFEPPFDAGKVIVTFTSTLPFLTVEEEIAEIVGAEGLVIFAFASAVGAMARLKPSDVINAIVLSLLIFSGYLGFYKKET